MKHLVISLGAMRRTVFFMQLTWDRFEILCSQKDETIWLPYCLFNRKQIFNVYYRYVYSNHSNCVSVYSMYSQEHGPFLSHV